MRNLAKCLGVVAFFLVGCALSDEPAGSNGPAASGQLEQGLTVLKASDGHLSLAYRQGDVVVFMEALRGRPTPDNYQADPLSPRYEIDAQFMDAGGFIFHI